MLSVVLFCRIWWLPIPRTIFYIHVIFVCEQWLINVYNSIWVRWQPELVTILYVNLLKFYFFTANIDSRIELFFQFSALFTGVLDDTKKTKLIEALGFFEIMLKGRTWAAVNNFTIADLALTITVAQLMSLRFDLEPYTRIRTWLERCKEFLRPHGYDVCKSKSINSNHSIFNQICM